MKLSSFVSAILLFLAFPLLARAGTTSQNYSATSTPIEIRAILASKMGSTSPMMPVIECESGFRQFDRTGAVLTSHTRDVGIFQINEIWWETAEKLGHDISTIEGNIDMGLYILEKQGIGAWVCARIVGVI